MKLALVTYPFVESYLKERRSIIIPIGSVEQHCPVGLTGTDHLIAEEIAYQVGENTGALVAPTMSYGMSNHHLGFPGTVSLNPRTLIAVIIDVIDSLNRNGFKEFYFVNGHGGNVNPVLSAFSEITREKDISCKIQSWWTMAEMMAFNEQAFGSEDGHHATASEISQTIYFYESRFELPLPSYSVEEKEHCWPLSPEGFMREYPDGRMASNPGLASYEKGKEVFEKAVELIERDFLDFERLGK